LPRLKQTLKLEAAKIIASAKEAIESEKKEALAELKAEVAQLSISVAEKLLKEELSDAKKGRVICERFTWRGKLKINYETLESLITIRKSFVCRSF
jgi:F-type H+-transporting ATPase subunit b